MCVNARNRRTASARECGADGGTSLHHRPRKGDLLMNDFDKMSYCEIEKKILEVKELIRFLAETEKDFPTECYFDCNEILKKVVSFVDEKILND